MKIITFFKNDMKRLLKDFGVFIGLLLMPLVIIIPTILSADFANLGDDTEDQGTPIGVVDYDGGEVSLEYIKELEENLLVEQDYSDEMLVQYDLQNDPRCAQPGPACVERIGLARLIDGSLAGLLIIPEGLTQSFNDGERTSVILYFDPGGDALLATQVEKVSQGLAIKVALTQQIEGAKDDFTDLNSISDPKVRTEIDRMINQPTVATNGKTAIHVEEITPTGYTEKAKIGPVEQSIPQMSVLFIFLFPMFLTAWVREEQANGLFKRLLSTPASKSNIIVGKLVFGILVCTIQMVIIFALGILASYYKGHFIGIDIPGFLVLTLALSATSASVGLLISSTKLPTAIALAPMLLGGVLGGAILLPDFMPAFMQPFSFLMPQRYGVDGYVDLLGRGGDLISILPEAGFLLLFTVIFTGIAIWRFDPMD
jgi:ABC-2 type transport system permease protein